MLNNVTPPPGAVSESCIELTAPVDVPVVDAAKSAEAASPKRVSLPSIAPPASPGRGPGGGHLGPGEQRDRRTPAGRAITARIAPPWRRSPTMMPKAQAIANGMTRSRKISKRLVNGVGFSNGCAEFAL